MGARTGGAKADWRTIPLADEAVTVRETKAEDKVFLDNPSVATFPGGRIVAAFDQAGPGVRKLGGSKGRHARTGHWLQGCIAVSGDRGQTWTAKGDFPFCQARLFRDGNNLYLLGHRGNLQIMRSSDGGETWSRPTELTGRDEDGGEFVGMPSNACVAADHIHFLLPVNRDPSFRGRGGAVTGFLPLCAPCGSDLTSRRSWQTGPPGPAYREFVGPGAFDHAGIPFHDVHEDAHGSEVAPGRRAHAPGWDAPQLVSIADAEHLWHAPDGSVLHVLAAAQVHRGNLAVLAQLVRSPGGGLAVRPQHTPGGARLTFLPLPGGNLRFALLHDEMTGLFWLVGHRVMDSLRRPDRLPPDRRGLPCDDETKLQLSFSRNLVDWSTAACLAEAPDAAAACRHVAVAVRGEDLVVLGCRGAVHGRHADRIECRVVPDFRSLAY